MKNFFIVFITMIFSVVYGGDIIIGLDGINPLKIKIKGKTQNEQAANISLYLYYCDDGTTSLNVTNVTATTIETTWGWGTGFLTKTISTGSWIKNGRTYTKRLLYDNVDLTGLDDYWTTTEIDAVICTFTTYDTNGHVYVEETESGVFKDWSNVSHNVTFSKQESSLPVQMGQMEAMAIAGEGINLTWYTLSSVNSAGFHVWRSSSEKGKYDRVSTSMIAGKGNSSSKTEYKFLDRNISDGIDYWYQIEEISIEGRSEFFGPISVTGIPLPTEYAMPQNFPNPFNPETTIKYELPELSEVSVRVYSLLGREVKTLVNKFQNAGRYSIKWNGTGEDGRRAPSGIYFVRIQAGSYSQIRKMTFIQ